MTNAISMKIYIYFEFLLKKISTKSKVQKIIKFWWKKKLLIINKTKNVRMCKRYTLHWSFAQNGFTKDIFYLFFKIKYTYQPYLVQGLKRQKANFHYHYLIGFFYLIQLKKIIKIKYLLWNMFLNTLLFISCFIFKTMYNNSNISKQAQFLFPNQI